MHYTVPDNRAFVVKSKIKTKTKKTEAYLRLEQFYNNNTTTQHNETTLRSVETTTEQGHEE